MSHKVSPLAGADGAGADHHMDTTHTNTETMPDSDDDGTERTLSCKIMRHVSFQVQGASCMHIPPVNRQAPCIHTIIIMEEK